AIAELADEEPKRFDLVALVDKQLRLVGCALAEKVERCNAQSPSRQCVAVRRPKLRILREPINKHIGRGILRTIKSKTDAMRAMRQKRHSFHFVGFRSTSRFGRGDCSGLDSDQHCIGGADGGFIQQNPKEAPMKRLFVGMLLVAVSASLASAQPFSRRSSQQQHDGLKKY